MADTGSTKSKTLLEADFHNDHDDDEVGATNSASRPISTSADDRSPQTAQFLLVVVGKAGTGKSSLCNLITGTKDLFLVTDGLRTCTIKTQEETVSQYGHTFCVMDTPDREVKGDMAQLANSLKVRLANFNNKVFFLFCVRCDTRYAANEHSIFLEFKDAWKNDHDFKSRLLVAFTHSDKLIDDADEGENLQTDTATADNGANNGSLDAVRQDPGVAQSEQEPDARKSAIERRLKELIDVTWPQLKQLVNDARIYFIFSNKETSEVKDDQRLLNFAAEYTPLQQVFRERDEETTHGYITNNKPASLERQDCWHTRPCGIMSYFLTIVLLLTFVLLLLTISYFVWHLVQYINNY